jgi:hypothetical protein
MAFRLDPFLDPYAPVSGEIRRYERARLLVPSPCHSTRFDTTRDEAGRSAENLETAPLRPSASIPLGHTRAPQIVHP